MDLSPWEPSNFPARQEILFIFTTECSAQCLKKPAVFPDHEPDKRRPRLPTLFLNIHFVIIHILSYSFTNAYRICRLWAYKNEIKKREVQNNHLYG